MSVKYAILKKVARLANFQKIMAQPYTKLQGTFKTANAVPNIPALQDPELTFETRTLCGQPVFCTSTTSSRCRKCASTWWAAAC